MFSSKKFALLECGILPDTLPERFGRYQRVFQEWLEQTAPQGASFTLHPYDVQKLEYPPEDEIDSYDAIIYSGSGASAYADVEWNNKLLEFTGRVAREKPRIKLIGICYGHQMIGRAYGSKCVNNQGRWELGPLPLNLTQVGKEIFGVDTLSIQQMHQDHVPVVPPEFELLASTSISNNQGMVKYYPDARPDGTKFERIHILTLQGHPEYTEPIITGVVEFRSGLGVITAEQAADAMRRRFDQVDGFGVLAKVIWEVLGVPA